MAFAAKLLLRRYRLRHHLVALVEGLFIELFGSLGNAGKDSILDRLGLCQSLVLKHLRRRTERHHVDNDLASKLLTRRSDDGEHVDFGVKLRGVRHKEVVEDDCRALRRIMAVGVARLLCEDDLKVGMGSLRIVYFAAVVNNFRLGSAAAGLRAVSLALY